MGLTSNSLLVLAVAVAVVLFGITLWLWPRLARRSWRAFGGRVGLLLATQLALICSLGVAANQTFGFYAGWDDLLGRETDQGVLVDHSATTSTGGPLQVVSTKSAPGGSGSRASTAGQVQKVDIVGRVSRIATPAYVYLPPEYFQPRFRTRTFPVSVVLTGYPGTAQALVTKLKYPATARDLAKDGRMQPMILVMMRPTVAPPRDTECVDIPRGPQTETFFAQDLPEAVLAHYRAGTRPGSWGIIGDSTGGYCALKIAMRHPGVYAAGAGLSAYYKAPVDPTTGDLFHGDRNLRDHADLHWLLAHEPAPDTSLLVTSSKVGEHNYRDTLKFLQEVRATGRTRISSIILDSGGHNFNTWRREIPTALQWLSGRLSDR
ncbi:MULTISPECIES: alpha/beta hydrolase [unclassified Streptomyces]|uniref:alpha/beta hydrolase n=1 Tax=unclassified Streptomyces TaxID=2593676 RepID=UPI002E2A7D2B|nr:MULTISPECIES: alpha/beta hydrolase-fold protein [unclassified Streptomyces]WUB87518.1 alpha/beta hydrolase-fold protein [Streptomyces sp. NBC_00566]